MRPLFLAPLGLLACCAGCLFGSDPPPATRTFVVPPPDMAGSAGPKVAASVGVFRFGASEELRQAGLIYRVSKIEIARDPYSRWSSPPSDLLSERLADALKRTDRFAAVVLDPYQDQDVYLKGTLLSFEEEIRMEGDPPAPVSYARLRLEIEVWNRKRDAVLAALRFDESTKVEPPPGGDSPSPEGVVRALGDLFGRAANAVALKVVEGARAGME